MSPRILAAGAPVTRPGGHCHFFGIEVAEPREGARAVETQAGFGADLVKVIASGGGLTPGTDPGEADLPPALIQAAVEAARAHGMHVAAHFHAVESIVQALDAGVACIEHATLPAGTGLRCSTRPSRPESGTRARSSAPPRRPGCDRPDHSRCRFVEWLGPSRDRAPGSAARPSSTLPRLGSAAHPGTDCGVTNVPFGSLLAELRE